MHSELFKQNELASAILDTIGAVVCVMDIEGKIVLFNQASQKLTGYTEEEVLNQYPWDLVILPEEIENVKDVFNRLTLGDFPNTNINYWLTKSGDRRLISWTNTALSDEKGNITFVIATGIDITEQRKAEEQVALHQKNLEQLVAKRTSELNNANKKLQLVAYQDALTGLYNRRYFNIALDNEIRRTRRSHEPLSLLMCDVDYFKAYNDTFGHVAGDNCLQEIADLLRRHFQRASDLVARYGGEEFCVILPDIDFNEAKLLTEQLRLGIMQHKIIHQASQIAEYVTLSIGVVTCPSDTICDADMLIRGADKALYKAKNGGRNRVESVLISNNN